MSTATLDARHEQQIGALEKANAQRTAMSQRLREIHSLPPRPGRWEVASLLDDPSSVVGAIKVGALLRSIRGVGFAKADRWMTASTIRSGDRRIRDLTERQRIVLATTLRTYSPWKKGS